MVVLGMTINRVLVELFFLFILSGQGEYPMNFEMTDPYDNVYEITVESDGDNYNIIISSDYLNDEIYAEFYDVLAYKIYQKGTEPYVLYFDYIFEIELTDSGFPEQLYNHPEAGEIYLNTGEDNTVIECHDKGITLTIDNESWRF